MRIKFPQSGDCPQKRRNGRPTPNQTDARSLRRTPTGTDCSRRRAQRETVVMLAYCRTATGHDGDIGIVDLTAEGCCITAKAIRVATGLHVRIRPGQFEYVSGIVRWVRRGYAGIEFDRPLSSNAAEHLQRLWSANGAKGT